MACSLLKMECCCNFWCFRRRCWPGYVLTFAHSGLCVVVWCFGLMIMAFLLMFVAVVVAYKRCCGCDHSRVEDANVNNRKPRAVKLRLLPAGSISFEQQVEGLWEGVVKREPCQPSMARRSGGRGHGGWGEESAMGSIGDVKAVLPLELSAVQIQKPHQSTAPVPDATEFSRDGGLSPGNEMNNYCIIAASAGQKFLVCSNPK